MLALAVTMGGIVISLLHSASAGWINAVTLLCVAIFVSWLIHKIRVVNTLILGLPCGIFACVLHALFSETISLIYVIIAFIGLGAMWAIGNTASIIAAQMAVSPGRKSVATGTIVTLFNIGGSIGLAVAIAIYHAGATHALRQKVSSLGVDGLERIKQFIGNPSDLLHGHISVMLHEAFNTAFLQGFSSVMWSLSALLFIALLGLLSWSLNTR